MVGPFLQLWVIAPKLQILTASPFQHLDCEGGTKPLSLAHPPFLRGQALFQRCFPFLWIYPIMSSWYPFYTALFVEVPFWGNISLTLPQSLTHPVTSSRTDFRCCRSKVLAKIQARNLTTWSQSLEPYIWRFDKAHFLGLMSVSTPSTAPWTNTSDLPKTAVLFDGCSPSWQEDVGGLGPLVL